jgi:hypothetical protein
MTATTTEQAARNDCGRETLALLRRCPRARGFVGSCIIRGGRSLLTGEPVPGVALPWTHHVWALSADGVLIDPTAADLLPAELREWYAPPAPLEQLRPVIVWAAAAQDAELAQLHPLALQGAPPCHPAGRPAELLYLPGRVADARPGSRWERLAKRSRTRAGFGPAELAAACDRRPAPVRRFPQGFAQEVA